MSDLTETATKPSSPPKFDNLAFVYFVEPSLVKHFDELSNDAIKFGMVRKAYLFGWEFNKDLIWSHWRETLSLEEYRHALDTLTDDEYAVMEWAAIFGQAAKKNIAGD